MNISIEIFAVNLMPNTIRLTAAYSKQILHLNSVNAIQIYLENL